MGINKIIIGLVFLICLIGCVKFLLLFFEYRNSKQNLYINSSTSTSMSTSMNTSILKQEEDAEVKDAVDAVDALVIYRLGECEKNLEMIKNELKKYEDKAIVVKVVEKNISKNITDVQEHLLMNLRPEHPSTAAYSAGFDECKRSMLDILGLKKTKFAERASVMDTRRFIEEDFFKTHICFYRQNSNFTDYIEIGLNRFFVIMRNESLIKLGIVD